MNIDKIALDFIKHTSVKRYPDEAVFAIDNYGLAWELKNIAPDPSDTFMVSAVELSMIAGVVGIVHSHPDGPAYPSVEDMRSQIASGLEFGIIVCSSEDAGGYFEWGGKNNRPPLMDRPFRHGVTDCYAFIRDYYLDAMGIDLADFPRRWEWWDDGESLYLDGFSSAGFVVVDKEDMRQGDMLLIALKGEIPIHAGVCTGDNEFSHHLGGSIGYDPSVIPRVDTISRWQKHITHVMRHKDAKSQD